MSKTYKEMELDAMMNTIHNVDCLEFMKGINDNYFDCIFSDVPYVLSKGGCSTKSSNGMKNKWNNNPDELALVKNGKTFKHNDITEKDYLDPLYRVLADTGHIYIMTNSLHLANIQKEMERVGFIINNILVMVKNNCVTNQHYMKNCEFVIFARKGGSKGLVNFGLKSAVNVNMPNGKEKIHITQKPVSYVASLIQNSTKEDSIVFDPFMGSGTTAVACQSLGLNWVGCELDKDYCKAANKRLSEKVQGGLF